jgi:uncharacterized membrane protein (DUF485 family)
MAPGDFSGSYFLGARAAPARTIHAMFALKSNTTTIVITHISVVFSRKKYVQLLDTLYKM